MEGQMDIFQFLAADTEPVERDFETMTVDEAAEIISSALGGVHFEKKDLPISSESKHEYVAKYNGFKIAIHFNHHPKDVFDGRRYLDTQINYKLGGAGTPAVSVDDSIEFIKNYIYKSKNAEKCTFSGHSCNKKELWKIAESLDNPFCPHVCCRFCSSEGCGARCNGSVNAYGWHDITIAPEEDTFCEFEYLWSRNQKNDSKGRCTGWWKNGKVQWLNMPYDIGKKEVIRWKQAPEPIEQEVEEVKMVVVKGYMDDGYCPECDACLDDEVTECQYCGCKLDWTDWRRVNGKKEDNY